MSFLLDTNILSELRKGRRASTRVVAWIESVDDEDLWTSVLVIGELRQGVERRRVRDPVTAAHLERWLDTIIESYGDRLLSIDNAVADRWGRMNVPDPLPVIDGLLAATAMTHDLTLVTRNIRDIRRTGVKHLNPFA